MRDAFTTVHARMLDTVRKGLTLEQVLDAKPSREFDARFAPENVRPHAPFTTTRWITQMFNEPEVTWTSRSRGRGDILCPT